MNNTFTSIISNKKELMDKIEILSKSDSKQGSLDRDSIGDSPRMVDNKHEKYKSLL